jgi:hypothetical protein
MGRGVVIMMALLLGACGGEAATPGSPELPVEAQVADLFRDFYQQVGGVEVLGPAISPLFPGGPASYQYTQNALLSFDPGQPEGRRYALAPVGLDLGVAQPAEPTPSDPALRYIDGHVLAPDFIPLYEKLGARLVGSPLTAARYNPGQRRFEQYFANLGIYRAEDEPRDSLRLLAYGDWKCDQVCPGAAPGGAEVTALLKVAPVFAETVARLGLGVTGFPISEAFSASDGHIEQTFENVTLAYPPQQGARVSLRPISELLGIQGDEPGFYTLEEGMTFVNVSADRGFNVPNVFLEFLAPLGGLEFCGPPVSEATLQREGVIRQCYRNLCLEEHRRERYPFTVRLAPLGYSYQQMTAAPGGGLAAGSTAVAGLAATLLAAPVEAATLLAPAPGTLAAQTAWAPTQAPPPSATPLPQGSLEVQARAKHGELAAGQSQEIIVRISQANRPAANIEPDLTLFLPDGSKKVYYLYPTEKNGQTSYSVAWLDYPPGSVIRYQVCAYDGQNRATCVEGEYALGR